MSEPFIQLAENDTVSLICQKPGVGSLIPAGLEYLYSACRLLYPDQPNPLQVTAVVKFWLGGPDPLDYISMYYNKGDEELQIPQHWHYVSFGLSDLHGDGRVHEVTEPHLPSGFGFELTMRVKCKDGEKTPPTWPATLMQGLAKYVFQTDSFFCAGDHISWHNALDNTESRIQHMLISEDPKLSVQNTPYGRVQFLQIVGLTAEELQAAQRWNGSGVLNIMKRFPECGGIWHITDMRRGESIFDMDPSIVDEVENGIEKEGSNLSGVSAKISWSLLDNEFAESSEYFQESYHCNQIKDDGASKENTPLKFSHNNYQNFDVQSIQIESLQDVKLNENCPPEKGEAFVVQSLPSLQLTINLESASLLPLMLRGRLKHGRHFTFKSPLGLNALTFLTPSVEGGFVSSAAPYAIKGPWLQILVNDELFEEMSRDLATLANPEEITIPVSYEWRSKKLKIIVIGNDIM